MGDEEFGMSPMREAAIHLHEMFEELRRAGFSRREAMEIVGRAVAEGMRNESDGNGSV